MGLKSESKMVSVQSRTVIKSDHNGIEILSFLIMGTMVLRIKSDHNGIEIAILLLSSD